MLKIFKGMFGEKFFENTAFLFTRWSYAKKDVRARKEANDTENEKQRQFNHHLKSKGIYNAHQPLRCFFIDNTLSKHEIFEDSTDEEQEKFLAVKQEIKNWVRNQPRFDCKDITEVEKEKDELARKKKEAEDKL